MSEFDYLDTNMISYKAHSKKEMYDMLSSPSGIYLPPLADANYKYIYQLCKLERSL